MGAILLLPSLTAVVVGAVALLAPGTALTRYSGVAVSAVVLVTGVALLGAGAGSGGVPELAGGILRADALSSFMLTVIGAVGLTATWGGVPPVAADGPAVRPTDRRYFALICVFLGAMSLAVLTDNLGVLWVAVEATTITTAFLVGHRGTKRSVEAAWKYVVLGSVGVAIALLGTVLLYAAAHHANVPTLSWTALASGAIPLDPGLVRVAVGLMALGYATKADLAPMHSWLPDALSQAIAPVAGLMSGVLAAVAFYAILRVQAISDAVLGVGLMRGLLLAAALLSLAVAAALLLRQRCYKRMLAYSSIEHMGVIALGAAVGGPLAIAAVLLHVLGHGLAKATLFVVAGRIFDAEGTTQIAEVRSLLARRPRLAIPFVAGMATLLGFPPFALFFSEVTIVLAGWRAGLGWAMAIAVGLLFVLFAGLARATAGMVLGPARDGSGPATEGGAPGPAVVGPSPGPALPLALALGTTAVAGFLVVPFGTVLERAAAALGLG